MSDPRSNKAYDDAYQRMQTAWGNTKAEPFCVHTCEFTDEMTDEEMRSVFRVMSGEPKAIYDDTATGKQFRLQKGDPKHGMIGMATTAITPASPIHLWRTGSGLCLINPPISFISRHDINSIYMENDVHSEKPSSKQVGVLQWPRNEKSLFPEIDEVLDGLQFDSPNLGRKEKRMSIDPKSTERQGKARAAYDALMEFYDALGRDAKPHWHNEAVVNAKLEHFGGIFVNVTDKMPDSADPIDWDTFLHADGGKEVAMYLLDAVRHAAIAKQVIDEYHAKHPKAHIAQPTIAIYDCSSTAHLHHFPPTQHNIELLEQVRDEKAGVSESDILLAQKAQETAIPTTPDAQIQGGDIEGSARLQVGIGR
ncbi:MAG: hypothetical protein MRY32_01160 [Rickettsiales bacterium]|nr:hypothetical protein [Rickettsiales bacterium]